MATKPSAACTLQCLDSGLTHLHALSEFSGELGVFLLGGARLMATTTIVPRQVFQRALVFLLCLLGGPRCPLSNSFTRLRRRLQRGTSPVAAWSSVCFSR